MSDPISESAVTLLDHLERRRGALEQAQWQAPTLTITAQAFLLAVLTDSGVSSAARAVILAAGITACVAAVCALLRLRSREVLYSEVIAFYARQARLPDTRADELQRNRIPLDRRRGVWNRLDQLLQAWAASWQFPIYLFWVVALVLFIAADAVAFAVTP